MADFKKIDENIKSSKKRVGDYDKKYVGLPPQDLPYSKKKSNNNAWAKECMDYYSDSKGVASENGRLRRMRENYDIAAGRWDMNSIKSSVHDWASRGEVTESDLSTTNVTHYPIVNQIISSLVGDQNQRYFQPKVTDLSRGALSEKKKISDKLIKEYLEENVLKPIQEQAKALSEEKVRELLKDFDMATSEMEGASPEEMAGMQEKRDAAVNQVRAQAMEEAKAKTPEDVLMYMNTKYKSPREAAFQKILDALVRELDISRKIDRGFEDAIITGEVVFRTGIRHGKPFFDCVNPMKFRFWNSAHSEKIEDAEAMIYEDYVRVSDLYHRYGDVIKPSDDKKIKNQLINGEATYSDEERRLLLDFSVESGRNMNWHTREGQEGIKQIYGSPEVNKLLPSLSNELIKEQHIVWKSRRKLKRVTRIVSGRKMFFWRDASYRMDEVAGDIEVVSFSVPEYWEGVKIGVGSEAVYLNVGPVKNQYRSISDPYTVKAPYFGGKLNDFSGNTSNTSLVDLGKPWQFKYNIEMSRLEELQETNVGKVMAMTLRNLPEGYTWQEWFTMLKKGKVALLEDNDGMGGFDQALLRSIDLGQMNDIAGTINLLNYYQNNLAVSMLYNPSRLGQVSPYITNATNDQNIQQSFNQTRKIFDAIDRITQDALNGLFNSAKVAYRDNPDYIVGLVNSVELAQLIESDETFWTIDTGVYVDAGSEQTEDIRNIKAQALAMIQNSQDINLVIELQLAKSVGEIKSIGNRYANKMDQIRQREQEMQEKENQLKQQELEQSKAISEERLKADLQKHEAEMTQKNIYARLESMKLRNMMDVNQNNIADNVEKYLLERQDKRYEVDTKNTLKLRELELEAARIQLEYYKANLGEQGKAMDVDSRAMIEDLKLEIANLKSEAAAQDDTIAEAIEIASGLTPEITTSEIVQEESERGFDLEEPVVDDESVDPFE